MAHDDPPVPPRRATTGFFSFTALPGPEHHRAYNEWHQLDHMPEQMPLPGLLFGQRWVATPACRRARAAADPELGTADYLTLYLMGEPIGATLEGFWRLARQLAAAGRFFPHRQAVLSGPFAVCSAMVAPRVAVSAAALPYRPHHGVYVVVESDEAHRGTPPGDPAEILNAEGVAGVWSFASTPTLSATRWHPEASELSVCFLDRPVLEVAAALGRLFMSQAAARGATIRLAAPFETIVPWQWDWFDHHAGESPGRS
jgi:hypothetical protein